MAPQNIDLATAVPQMVAAAEAYRTAVEKHNAEADDSKARINTSMTAVVAAVNNIKALGLEVGETFEYRNPDDISRVLDTLKVVLRQVSLSAII